MDQKDQNLLIKIFYFSLLKIFSRFMFEQQNKGVVVEEVVEEVVDSNNNKIIHEVQVHQPNIITTLQTSTMAMATITTMHTIDLKAPYHHPVEEG